MFRFEWLVAIVVLFGGVSCQKDSPAPSGSAPQETPMAIEDVTWQLAEVGGKRAEPVPADERAPYFRLSPADKRVSGYGSVNQFNGGYELNGKSLKFGMLAMTMRAGPDELMKQEFAFTQAMSKVAAWRGVGGNAIELLDGTGQVLAKFTRAGS